MTSVHAESVRMDSRSLRIVNQAGHRIDVFWINRWENDALSLSTAEGGVLFGTESGLNSFIGHEFEVHELPSKKTGTCGGEGGVCRKGHFQVNANDDQCKSFTLLLLLCVVAFVFRTTSHAFAFVVHSQ